jgi:hypothetical protein
MYCSPCISRIMKDIIRNVNGSLSRLECQTADLQMGCRGAQVPGLQSKSLGSFPSPEPDLLVENCEMFLTVVSCDEIRLE